jgi:hypothetical protein
MNFRTELILKLRAIATELRATATELLDSLFLWLGTRIEASKLRRNIIAIRESKDVARPELASKADETARPVAEAAQEYPVITQSLNLTRRARALHMRRRGDEPHTIAAALGISNGEVDLLFKLDRILQQRQ